MVELKIYPSKFLKLNIYTAGMVEKPFYICQLFDTAIQMRVAFEEFIPGSFGDAIHGVVCPYTRQHIGDDQDITYDDVGYIFLNRELLTASLLAHESLHVALDFLRRFDRLNLSPHGVDEGEEALAYLTQNVFEQLYQLME
jgi:hypothetical protein